MEKDNKQFKSNKQKKEYERMEKEAVERKIDEVFRKYPIFKKVG